MSNWPSLIEASEAAGAAFDHLHGTDLSSVVSIEAVQLVILGQVGWFVAFSHIDVDTGNVCGFYACPSEAEALAADIAAVHRRERHQRWTWRPGGDKVPV